MADQCGRRTIPASAIDEISRLPSVQNIETDAVIQAPVFNALQVSPLAAAAPEWNISMINAPSLWNAGLTGSGIVVASLDTGVDLTHPDLFPSWRGGACALPPDCESWFYPFTSSTMPYDQAGPFTGHGTEVMGILLGSSSADYYGVAPDARWISAKIFDNNSNTLVSTIISALEWIMQPGGNPANASDVVNNSWGFTASVCSSDAALQAAIQAIRSAGIAVVFSAGNNGPAPSTGASPNGVLLSGPNPGDFFITADSCSGVTLPSLGSCMVSAYFGPVTTGPKNAVLQVASDDPHTPVLNIPLSGTGVLAFTVARVHNGVTVGLYSSIRTAYENCVYSDTIKLKNTIITESPDFNLSPGIAISLLGGYEGTFGLRTGFTAISGSLTITTGAVTVDSIILQ